jgi:hypothetical protein
LIRPNIADGSFVTEPFSASAEQCPLYAESDQSRHASELTRSANNRLRAFGYRGATLHELKFLPLLNDAAGYIRNGGWRDGPALENC